MKTYTQNELMAMSLMELVRLVLRLQKTLQQGLSYEDEALTRD